MILRTRLKIIRCRERYLDWWESLDEKTHKSAGMDHGRWSLFLLFLLDAFYYLARPNDLIKSRHGFSMRVIRVHGVTRSTTRCVRAWTKEQRIKWKDQEPTQCWNCHVAFRKAKHDETHICPDCTQKIRNIMNEKPGIGKMGILFEMGSSFGIPWRICDLENLDPRIFRDAMRKARQDYLLFESPTNLDKDHKWGDMWVQWHKFTDMPDYWIMVGMLIGRMKPKL